MTFLMSTITVLTIVSLIALLGLFVVYYRNFKSIKSKFTIGLLIFVVLFLIQNIVSLYYYATMMDYYVPQVEVHVFILTLLQAFGFLTLLKISWE